MILDEAKLLGAGAALLAIAAAVIWLLHEGAQHERATNAAAIVATQKEDIAIGARRVQNLSEAVDDAQLQNDHLRDRLAAADRARDDVSVQLAAIRRAHPRPADPAASRGGAPVDGGDPIGVLADVLGRAEAREDVVELLADQRGVRAALCERAYDTLKQ